MQKHASGLKLLSLYSTILTLSILNCVPNNDLRAYEQTIIALELHAWAYFKEEL